MNQTTLSKLLVSRAEADEKIQTQIEEGKQLSNRDLSNNKSKNVIKECEKWSEYNKHLLSQLFDSDSIAEDEYVDFYYYGKQSVAPNWTPLWNLSYLEGMDKSLNSLERIRERLELLDEPSHTLQHNFSNKEVSDNLSFTSGINVFIVHGHDEAAKHAIARFVERLGLKAIILDEQANKGQTIIEKFEEHAGEVGFAIVLLTPDDVGAPKDKEDNLKPRARQNVILELGYFLRALGREHVCVLYKEEVELPSDIHGILYVPMDSFDGWKQKLAKEMKQAGLPINPEKLL